MSEKIHPKLQQLFDKAVQYVTEHPETIKRNLSKVEQLGIYGLFHFITEGELRSGSQRKSKIPSLPFSKSKAKECAWKACKGFTVKEAIKKYVQIVKSTCPLFEIDMKMKSYKTLDRNESEGKSFYKDLEQDFIVNEAMKRHKIERMTLDNESVTKLKHKLERFLRKYDIEELENQKDSDFKDLISLADNGSEDLLNEHLKERYGKSLSDLKRKKSTVASAFPTTSAEKSKKFHNNSSTRKSLLDLDIEHQRQSMAIFPEYVKPALVHFYLRHEPKRLKDKSANKVYHWARRHGLEKLNAELKRRYDESLNEFVEKVDKMRAELIMFFCQVDPKKITTPSSSFNLIYEWGVRHGREALCEKLRKKYKSDLDSHEKVKKDM